jgi:hypothetical protein
LLRADERPDPHDRPTRRCARLGGIATSAADFDRSGADGVGSSNNDLSAIAGPVRFSERGYCSGNGSWTARSG